MLCLSKGDDSSETGRQTLYQKGRSSPSLEVANEVITAKQTKAENR